MNYEYQLPASGKQLNIQELEDWCMQFYPHLIPKFHGSFLSINGVHTPLGSLLVFKPETQTLQVFSRERAPSKTSTHSLFHHPSLRDLNKLARWAKQQGGRLHVQLGHHPTDFHFVLVSPNHQNQELMVTPGADYIYDPDHGFLKG